MYGNHFTQQIQMSHWKDSTFSSLLLTPSRTKSRTRLRTTLCTKSCVFEILSSLTTMWYFLTYVYVFLCRVLVWGAVDADSLWPKESSERELHRTSCSWGNHHITRLPLSTSVASRWPTVSSIINQRRDAKHIWHLSTYFHYRIMLMLICKPTCYPLATKNTW